MTLLELIGLVRVAAQPGEAELNARESLVREALVTEQPLENGGYSYGLTRRGQVFLEHVLAQPLPEAVTVWRVRGRLEASGAAWERDDPRMTATEVLARQTPPPRFVAPPKPPIPTDPEELKRLALRLLDEGFGMNEVKERLELTEAQAQEYFYGGNT